MTEQELAEAFRGNIQELHTIIDALPDGATKRRAKRLASILHRAAEELADLAVGDDIITPLSGGDPKPEDE